MSLYFATDEAGYRQLAERRRARSDWLSAPLIAFNQAFRWAIRTGEAKDSAVNSHLSWLGWLALAGLVVSFFRPWRGLLWFVVLPTGFYLLSVFAVGDAVSRYLLPAESGRLPARGSGARCAGLPGDHRMEQAPSALRALMANRMAVKLPGVQRLCQIT